jgi:hypothetical protein
MLMIHSMGSQASTGEISCSTAFGEKTFSITDNSISFHKEDESGA